MFSADANTTRMVPLKRCFTSATNMNRFLKTGM